jgi:hypothetical protein
VWKFIQSYPFALAIIHGNAQSLFFIHLRHYHLSWWANNELDTLCDVTGKTLVASLKELLLVVVGTGDDVEDLLDTLWAKLSWNGEEVAACELLDLSTTINTWKVDEGWLDDARFTLCGADDLLSESGIVSFDQLE